MATALPWFVQAKLTIGATDDPLEREADVVAERVMRTSTAGSFGRLLSRKCVPCEEEQARTVRTKTAFPAKSSDVEVPDAVQDVLSSPGHPLDLKTRDFFQPRFGYDFAGVRVHADGGAAWSARALNAQAYTLGSDVVFGTGKYAPSSDEGRRLLAHELVHVVQQNGTAQRRPVTRNAEHPAARRSIITGSAAPAILRSESVHPEEQHCQDLSEESEPPCDAVIQCIEELIEIIYGRIADLTDLDPGHIKRLKIVRGILQALMVLAPLVCKNGEYDPELEEEAEKVVRKTSEKGDGKEQKTNDGPATEEQKSTLRERLPSVPKWVWGVIAFAAAALIIVILLSGVGEIAAILAAVGEAIGWIIITAMRLAGVGLLAEGEQPPPDRNDAGASAVS
ncbi:MAG TPA: DUF4157 domain-containing protein [Candidatus Dormibacteraeota bacterium]|nr:DUF4157 domain-containing protein [Candidatus Dormibacteraeota bacterium]